LLEFYGYPNPLNDTIIYSADIWACDEQEDMKEFHLFVKSFDSMVAPLRNDEW
jgi:hypothetical protein